jgi:acyl carrier protein
VVRKGSGATTELTAQVLDIARRLLREQGIQREPRLDISLAEDGLGFDSMRRLELLAAVEKECGVSIPEKYWSGSRVKNLNDLIRIAGARR